MKTKIILFAMYLACSYSIKAQAWSCTTIGGGCYRNGATGIGTNGTPQYFLDVRSVTPSTGISYIYTGVYGQATCMFQLGNTFNNKYWKMMLDGGTDGHFYITDGNSSPFFIHGSNKNIGIGTTAPLASLHAENTSVTNPVFIAKANHSAGGGNCLVSDVNYDNTYAFKVINRHTSTNNVSEDAFWINGNGQTIIGNKPSMVNSGFVNINIDGSLFPKALEMFDQYTGKVNFSVRSNGNVWCRELNVLVASSNFPDYVFKNDYKLMSLDDLSKYIAQNHHLPNIPTAEEAAKDGVQVGDMSLKQLEKIEELTLYIIELEKRLKVLESKK